MEDSNFRGSWLRAYLRLFHELCSTNFTVKLVYINLEFPKHLFSHNSTFLPRVMFVELHMFSSKTWSRAEKEQFQTNSKTETLNLTRVLVFS